jgi:CheY-like chemotaxis protein
VLAPPVTASDLYNAIAGLLAPLPGHRAPAGAPSVALGEASDAGRRSLKVLVAEDNPVNQQLATTLLEKAGHQVSVVGDGAEAVQAWAGGHFDLILMDLQMPHLGGLEATAMIREAEQARGPGHRRTPIVALTAHAMPGDEQRCLDAGMDGYLPKPLRRERLAAMLSLADGGSAPAGVTTAAGEPARRTQPSIDRTALLESLGNDPVAYSELREVFLASMPKLRIDLADAMQRADCTALARGAHALRGALATFHAQPGAELLSRLEAAASRGDLDAATALLPRAEREIAAVVATLEQDSATANPA